MVLFARSQFIPDGLPEQRFDHTVSFQESEAYERF